MTSNAFAIILGMLNLPLAIAVVVIFFRIKDDLDPRMRISLQAATAMMGFELVALALRYGQIEPMQFALILAQDVVIFLKFWVMFYVGQRLWADRGVDYWGLARFRLEPRKIILVGITAALAFVLYSVLLLKLTHPAYGPVAKMLGLREVAGVREALLVQLAVVNVAVAEELIFRGCFQSMFMRWFGPTPRGDLGAIACSTLLWTLMHFGMLAPDWVKFAQVLPLGLFLAFWFRRAGFIGCAGVHVLFNLIMTPLGQDLVAR